MKTRNFERLQTLDVTASEEIDDCKQWHVETTRDGQFALFCKRVDSFRNSLRTSLGQDGKLLRMSTALILRVLIDQHVIKLQLTTLIRESSICLVVPLVQTNTSID
jgi:hypothetical protein